MGKGDIKTKKGKITKGSYGVRRPRAKNKSVPAIAPTTKKATPKKKAPAAKKKKED